MNVITVLSQRVALGIVQVMAKGPEGLWTPANIMIDEGSDPTIVRDGFARQLGLHWSAFTLDVDGVSGVRHSYRSQRFTVPLETEDGELISIECSAAPTVTKPRTSESRQE